uniref:Fibronectin type III-like domain-containing protein n=1 Tax=Oryza brachyantha TaxID=4533 RepID=J3N7J3_ORYBR
MDVNCGNYTQVHAVGAVQQGKLTEKDIDRALINLFAVRVRLGHFDGDPRSYGLYGRLGGADVCSPAHRSLAVEAAQAGIVLLKNDAGALPLHLSSVASVAAIGPNADNLGALHGNYFGPPCETTTPLQGIRGYVGGRATFLAGCDSPAYSKFSYHLLTSSGDISMSSNTTPLAGITDSPTGTGDDGVSYLVKEIGVETCSQLIFPAVVEVQNHGTMDRKHSVLMYLRWPTSSGGRPATQLTGFQSQHLRAGEKAKLKFEVSPCEQLSWVREDGEKVIERGSHFLVVGDDEWEVSFGI